MIISVICLRVVTPARYIILAPEFSFINFNAFVPASWNDETSNTFSFLGIFIDGLSYRIYFIPELWAAFTAFMLASDANGCVASTNRSILFTDIRSAIS